MGRAKRPPFYIVVWRVTIDFEIRKGERAGAQFGYTTRYGSLTEETLHKTFSREGNCPPELGRQLLLNRRLVEIAGRAASHLALPLFPQFSETKAQLPLEIPLHRRSRESRSTLP